MELDTDPVVFFKLFSQGENFNPVYDAELKLS